MKNKSVDIKEIDKFSAIANEWWEPEGKFKPLHEINHVRMEYIINHLRNYPEKKTVLDVGCGGGILSESIAKLNYDVTGIDPSKENIEAAKIHSRHLKIDYHYVTIEGFAEQGNKFDVVLCMEVIEHVADIYSFINSCAKLLNENGLIFLSTINRTVKSYLQAIIGAEYILRWLPRGTHQWKKFVTPHELRKHFDNNNIKMIKLDGIKYSVVGGDWVVRQDLDVNYISIGQKIS